MVCTTACVLSVHVYECECVIPSVESAVGGGNGGGGGDGGKGSTKRMATMTVKWHYPR